MKLHLLEHRNQGGYVSFGTCWNRGEAETEDFVIWNENGNEVSAQNEVAARWPDGSVKWARHTADSEKLGAQILVQPGKTAVRERPLSTEEEDGGFVIDAGRIRLFVPKAGGSVLAEQITFDGELRMKSIQPVFELEHQKEEDGCRVSRVISCQCRIDQVELETAGPVICVVKYQGVFCRETNRMPFTIRMTVGQDSDELKWEHTFFYNGVEERDFLKGMGIRFDAALTGKPWNRHIKLGTDYGNLHEMAMYLYSYHPRTPVELRQMQKRGELIACSDGSEMGKLAEEAAKDLPVWNRYVLTQVAHNGYQIGKQTKKGCCLLDIESGTRAPGTMAVAGENGGMIVGMKDFWQRFPSGLEVDGLASETASCYAWFYSPQAQAMDYRHYDTRAYQLSNYEGYPEFGASANGIGVTSECFVRLTSALPSDEEFSAFTKRTQKPAVYVADPEAYYEKRAFGFWSLPCRNTEQEQRLERMLEQAVAFYQKELDCRSWYGLYNYGDFMHSYDEVRHCWKYDFGGCAWHNTELVPTYWLWLYFMRTGREDVFTLAEAMSRHCSETDVYHLGAWKGIGSRHNVRHWGCPCKEPRVSMAGHHRPMYYLTGDRRLGDYFDEVVCAPESLANITHFYGSGELEHSLLVRTGPDWAAFVSDWMTAYERTLDETYRQKILRGVKGILAAPMKLGSGPSFCFDPATGDMEYCGEFVENIHLTLCMGGPQIWLEAAEAIDCEELYQLAADYGKQYLMTDEERQAAYGQLCEGKRYGMSYVSAGISAFGAWKNQDVQLANRAWQTLMDASPCHHNPDGFAEEVYETAASGMERREIPWISTNYVSQWCLNIIMALEFIRESLPPAEEWDLCAAQKKQIPK